MCLFAYWVPSYNDKCFSNAGIQFSKKSCLKQFGTMRAASKFCVGIKLEMMESLIPVLCVVCTVLIRVSNLNPDFWYLLCLYL